MCYRQLRSQSRIGNDFKTASLWEEIRSSIDANAGTVKIHDSAEKRAEMMTV
jgi:hypothetical protein